MDTPIQVDLGRIAQDLQIRRVQVESVVQLLDEGNTVPFITRYRKERTANLNEVAIREIQVRVGRLRDLAERKETILKTIEAQGKLNDELREAIRAADNPKRLEDLYLPYKPKKRTKASEAREKGLEPLALAVWNRDESLTDLATAAQAYLNPEKELDTVEKVLEGAGHILGESISELAVVREGVRRVVWKTGKVVTTKAENVPDGEGLEYRDYFAYSEPVAHIPPHRVLAINRGDKEGPLKVKLEVSRPDLERAVFSQLPLEGHPQADFFAKAAIDSLDRLLLPSMEREVRRDLTEMAERHAVDVFARNLRSLLLQPPIAKQVVLAIDPGFRTGCKVTVLDGNGNLIEHGVIHPHPPQNRRHESKVYLKDLVGKHQVGVVAIGNGTACRETEELVAEIIAEGTHFHHSPDAPFPSVPTPAPAESAPVPEPTSEAAPAPEPIAESAPSPELAAEPVPSTPEVVAPANGSGSVSSEPTETPAEALPPIAGGAPDEDESETTPPTSSESPIETLPPPSSTPEAESAEAEAFKVQLFEHSEAIRDPSHPHVDESTPSDPGAETPEAAASIEGTEPAIEPSPNEAHEPAPNEAKDAAPIEAKDAAPIEAKDAAPIEVKPPKPPGGPSGRGHRGDQPRPPKPRMPPPPPKPHPADAQLSQLAYVIVNEAGASVYSASPVGREEFPDFDATLRGTISIGRRLQDPLAELVKIEPQNIGVGLYQHDVNPKQLKESLETVIESCVNFVGVDLNTASVPLLRHVSGLNQLTARRVVDFRKEKGPFVNRDQLKEVEGVGPATFTQSAGFLKIPGAANPLDRTWVHPESYTVAEAVLAKLGFTPEVILHKDQLPALHAQMNEADLPALAQELQVGEPTLHDIFEALARPERDPREDLPKPIFKRGVLKLEDLTAGMELKGTVLNVVDFGAFVDIGLKDSGLVHISQLANRYIKSPHDVVSVGDVATVWVMGVDQERKRVSLTMVKPGTERPRGAPGSGGRRPQGESRPQGGERRQGPSRPPRREGSAPQPAGAGAPSGEEPPRPADRPAGRGPGGPGGGGGRPSGPSSRGPGGPGRGGPRSAQGMSGGPQGRMERAQAPRPPARPAKPAPPPPPLSKDALAGKAPLRSFGDLVQFLKVREEPPESDPTGSRGQGDDPTPSSPTGAETQGPDQEEPNPDPQPPSDQSEN